MVGLLLWAVPEVLAQALVQALAQVLALELVQARALVPVLAQAAGNRNQRTRKNLKSVPNKKQCFSFITPFDSALLADNQKIKLTIHTNSL